MLHDIVIGGENSKCCYNYSHNFEYKTLQGF